MKYSRISGVVGYGNGSAIVLAKGDGIDDDHELVAERPELFTDDVPPAKHAGPARLAGDVETASTTPGGRRVTRR